MNILIVHAHPEPQSFNSALARRARETLTRQGHTVTTSFLNEMAFQPVSDRRNFTTAKDPAYFKQQQEETLASSANGFAPDLEAELRKLEACDALLFVFPLWWFGMPAIMKGWVDRVFAYGRIYGNGKLYENGLGQARKRGLVITSTGGGPDAYSGLGFNPPMDAILTPIHHGIFWFNGFLPLDPFIAWSPAHLDEAARHGVLDALDARLATLFTESPHQLPRLEDFPNYGKDRQKRFMVTITRAKPVDEAYRSLVPAELQRVGELKKAGIFLSVHLTPSDAAEWRGWVLVRAPDRDAAAAALATLPLASYLHFDIDQLAPH